MIYSESTMKITCFKSFDCEFAFLRKMTCVRKTQIKFLISSFVGNFKRRHMRLIARNLSRPRALTHLEILRHAERMHCQEMVHMLRYRCGSRFSFFLFFFQNQIEVLFIHTLMVKYFSITVKMKLILNFYILKSRSCCD